MWALDAAVLGAAALAVIGALHAPPPRALIAGEPGAVQCLALNIYHEARGEPREGKIAVGQVVINRVLDRRFPDSVCAVVKQGGARRRNRCQFSWWCDGRSDRPEDIMAWGESTAIAARLLDGRFDDPTGGALWYHADSVLTDWRRDLASRGKIGHHVFYTRAR